MYPKYASHLLILVFACLLVSCDTNGEEGISDEVFEDFTGMMNKAFSVFSRLSTAGIAEATPKQPDVLPCDTGQVTYTLTDTNTPQGSVFDVDFQDCDGVNGSIAYGIISDITDTRLALTLNINGQLEERCAISLNNLEETVLSDASVDPPVFSITLSGSIGATCGQTSFVCSFENDLLNDTNTNVFASSCSQ